MRVAVVGTGSVGMRHISMLISRRDCEVLAVSEFSKKPALSVDGVNLRVIHSYERALADSDVIFVANPTSMHAAYLKLAISEGKHVYVEKPVATTAEELHAAVDEAQANALVIAVGTQFRFNALLVRLKEILDNGLLGAPLHVAASSGEHIADYHPDEDYRESYAATSDMGGGVLLTQIHQIDYLNWLFGPFDAVVARQIPIPELEIDVEACVSYSLLHAGGLTVSAHLNYLQRPKHTALEVVGSRGRATWDYEQSTLSLEFASGRSERIAKEFDRAEMFAACHEDFFDAIAEKRKPRADLSDGLASLRLVEAIKRSLDGGALTSLAT